MIPNRRHIVLGVTGSIAAVKAAALARLLVGAGHDLRAIQTAASLHFIGPAALASLSGHPVATQMFGEEADATFAHIDLARSDLLVIAPATANTIGKMAAGIADNLLLATYLAADCPVVVAPAMNHHMWHHPAVRDNVALLAQRGAVIIPPGTGQLACGEVGDGRMAEPDLIFRRIQEVLGVKFTGDLDGVRVLVTAGGTREPIDSVRFIANRSSGKMGFALAEAAYSRGAEVTVIAANCNLAQKQGIRYVNIVTSEEMHAALEKEIDAADVLFMAAAVSDYKVSGMQTMGKLERKDKIDLQLIPTRDIVSSLGKNNISGLKVGFAAEFGTANLERARQKLRQKHLDMIVFNDISRPDIGFESDENEITIMTGDGRDVFVSKASKEECAHRIIDQVAATLS